MQAVTDVVNNYIAMWNEADPELRRTLVASTLSDDATYVDPLIEGAGTDQITAMIGAAQEEFPGWRFALVGDPDAHHDRVKFTWSLSAGGGASMAIGTDFAVLAADGRLQSVTGVLEQVAV
jgi:hypothetical protein